MVRPLAQLNGTDGESWIDVGPQTGWTQTAQKTVVYHGEPILLIRVDNQIYAIETVCPHHWASLKAGRIRGLEIECPAHLARFDIRTGERTYGPTRVGLKTCPVRLYAGSIWINPPLRYRPNLNESVDRKENAHAIRSQSD